MFFFLFFRFPHPKHWLGKYDRVILLIRDPYDAILSEFHRQFSGVNQTGFASIEKFSESCDARYFDFCRNGTLWEDAVKIFLKQWESHYNYFIDNHPPNKVHICQ